MQAHDTPPAFLHKICQRDELAGVSELGDAGRDQGEVGVGADPSRRDQLTGDLHDPAHAEASTP